MVRQELVVEHSVEREAAVDVAEADARAGALCTESCVLNRGNKNFWVWGGQWS